jgi:restriction system protein
VKTVNIPTYDQFVHPLLKVLALHLDGIKAGDAHDAVADAVGLTEDDRKILLAGGYPLYRSRIGWAHDRLKRRGLSSSPHRGRWQITDKGQQFLAAHPEGIDEDTLRDITFVEWPPKTGDTRTHLTDEVSTLAAKQSPEERIDAAISELADSVAAELHDLIVSASPSFFERLVLDVLHAMGYGVSRADLEQTGGTGDGGIDGIITLDRLGLEKVYVQAKRWTTGTVGREAIQSFFGALAGRKATKGVFITTSSFTQGAREFARQVSDHIVLVDGQELTSLMIEYGVGVSVQRTVKIARADHDYFEGT